MDNLKNSILADGPRVSCASATTACCRTAFANNHCPWPAHCSPPKATYRFRPCLTANSGTVPAAAKPYVSSSASPLHNSILQASIPHDRLCQSALPACSTHVFAGVCASQAEQLHHQIQRHARTTRLQTAHAIAHRSTSPSATIASPKSISSTTKPHSIAIIPSSTATAAPAASFSPPNRKRLGLSSEASSKTRLRGVSDLN
jgi:hypothetical protein